MNVFELPIESDVTQIDNMTVVKITPKNIDYLAHVALMQYANEPCRICGLNITETDVKRAVFAGYSNDGLARSAHEECWNRYPANEDKSPNPEWVHQ